MGGEQTGLAETHDSSRAPKTMHIIHVPTRKALTVWHLHFICILDFVLISVTYLIFWQIAVSKTGQICLQSESQCVGRETVASSDRKPFVTDDWVNRLVLINILIGALPSWTLGFLLFFPSYTSDWGPLVSVLHKHTKKQIAHSWFHDLLLRPARGGGGKSHKNPVFGGFKFYQTQRKRKQKKRLSGNRGA